MARGAVGLEHVGAVVPRAVGLCGGLLCQGFAVALDRGGDSLALRDADGNHPDHLRSDLRAHPPCNPRISAAGERCHLVVCGLLCHDAGPLVSRRRATSSI